MPNPSFEKVECKKYETFYLRPLPEWNATIKTAANVFFDCEEHPSFAPPKNANNGYQYPKEGSNLISLVVLNYFSEHSTSAIFTTLDKALDPRFRYYGSFFSSLNQRSGFNVAVQELGMVFTQTEPDTNKLLHEQDFYGNGFDVINTNGFLDDTSGYTWTKVGGIFQPNTFENYLVLGTFHDTVDIKRKYLQPSMAWQSRYFIDAITVIAYPELPPDTTLCQGESFWLKPHMPPGSQFEWFDGTSRDSILIDQPGTYWAMAYSEFDTIVDTIQVYQQNRPQIISKTLCEGDTVCVNLPVNPGTTLKWNDDNTANPRCFSKPDNYGYTLSSGSCSVSSQVNISLAQAPPTLPLDTQSCDTLLLGQNGLPHAISWSTGQTSATVQVSKSATIWRKAELNGCTFYDTTAVKIYQPYTSLQLDTSLCPLETLALEFDSLQVRWLESSALVLQDTGQFVLRFFDGCDTNAIQVNTRFNAQCKCHFYVPNAFTPDGDGLNESFFPVSNCEMVELYVDIYNRWGQRVYRGSQLSGWSAPTDLPMGQYFYHIQAVLNNGTKVEGVERYGGVVIRR